MYNIIITVNLYRSFFLEYIKRAVLVERKEKVLKFIFIHHKGRRNETNKQAEEKRKLN